MLPINESITKTELEEVIENKVSVHRIDIRNSDEYNSQHIPAAVNIPLDFLESQTFNFTKDHLFITTCGKGGGRSAQGAEKLKSIGFKAQWLVGGTNGWFEGV